MSGIHFRWESLAVLLAGAVVYIFFRKDMKDNGYVSIICEEIYLGLVISGLIGARIGWYLTHGLDTLSHFFLFFYDGFEPLFGIYTMIIFIFIYGRKNYMSFRRMMDCILPHMMLGMAVGWAPYIFSSGFNFRILLVVGVEMLGYLLLEIVYKRFFKDQHRGDRASLSLLWIGLSQFFVNAALYGRSQLTPIMIFPGFLTAGVALGFYVYNRIVKMDKKPLVLFDFDGTLMDTQAMVNESYRYLFNKYRTVDDFDDRTQLDVFGQEDVAAIKKLFQNEDANELTTEFRAFQDNLPALGLVNTMPYAFETLQWLKKNGYMVGVVTSRPTDNCRYWIEQFDLDDYVDMVMGAEVYKKAKPAPDALRRICHELGRGHDYCVYIGDHARDVRMAKKACVYAIGYVTSEKNRRRIKKAKPNRTIEDLRELIDILQETDHNWTYNLL